ncbi:MAG: hypothetical protein A4E64_00244 [Syntrophorhabdus sp. PtaU1.Bin058]|nr:MAG: hypothetical protein A4E64_00244 [Syntrophorhabdus sp. PtaU1.Bin058]
MSVKRLFSFAEQYFLRRSLPHGIVSLQYLLPDPPPKVRIHRRLWVMNRPSRIPLLLFLLIELFLWLRWVTFSGWLRSWYAVKHRGAAISEGEGTGKAAQLKKILCTSLCHCIPPAEVYAFGLYRPARRQEMWNYVFTHELPAFHHWRNVRRGGHQESSDLLQDKFSSTRLLGGQGVPTAPVMGLVSRNGPFDPAPYLHGCPRIFCKPRHGSGSRDAFVIEARDNGEGAAIFAVKSGIKAQPSAYEDLQKAMTKDDFLIQPFMDNHPVLAALCPAGDAVTVRLITEVHPLHGATFYCATLEIPDASDGAGYYHIILPVELSSGLVMRFPDRRLPAFVQARHDAFCARMGRIVVPFWEEIKDSAMKAHRCFPDVYAVAWDYVVTADGPYILEGNTGWGTTTPQVLHGGLLQDEDRED